MMTREVLPSSWSFEKTILSSGTGEATPHDFSLCQVSISNIDEKLSDQLKGYSILIDGTVTIGDVSCDVMETIDHCLQTMSAGETSHLSIHCNDMPRPLVYNMSICLKNFDATPAFHNLTTEDKVSYAVKHKNAGTELFNSDNVKYAFKHYSNALKYLICADSLSESQLHVMMNCYLNVAACQLKYLHYQHVVTNCTKALFIQGNNVKGLYRRATAYVGLNMLDEAICDYKAIADIEPKNKQVERELASVLQKRKTQDETLASRLKGMFS